VAVEFTTPDTAVDNIHRCWELELPVVVGTTGWHNQLEAVVAECKERKKGLFVASNFSIGMNIMMMLNRRLARLMNRHGEYSVSIAETHHIHKLDAPSGTAITLAKDIISEMERVDGWQLTDDKNDIVNGKIPVTSFREGEVPGIHTVTYDSSLDTITLSHSAKSRTGPAVAALLDAEFMVGRTGYYTMNELLEE
jgi:4-hydroxy-tetrahydrodipicolinate reductase